MYGDKDMFMELDKVIRGNVTYVDHSRVSIKEKCIIFIKSKDGSHQFIGNVYYIATVKS
jgi:hypothetical protein